MSDRDDDDQDDDDSPSPKRLKGDDSDPARGVPADLRNLMKRQSFGDILATLKPSDRTEFETMIRRSGDDEDVRQSLSAQAAPKQQLIAQQPQQPQQPQQQQQQPMYFGQVPVQQFPMQQFYGLQMMPFGNGAAMMPSPMTSPPQMMTFVGSGGGAPGTGDDTKKEQRLRKNRLAAKECRKKKKEYVKCLEERVRLLEQQNGTLLTVLQKAKSQLLTSKGEPGGEAGEARSPSSDMTCVNDILYALQQVAAVQSRLDLLSAATEDSPQADTSLDGFSVSSDTSMLDSAMSPPSGADALLRAAQASGGPLRKTPSRSSLVAAAAAPS